MPAHSLDAHCSSCLSALSPLCLFLSFSLTNVDIVILSPSPRANGMDGNISTATRCVLLALFFTPLLLLTQLHFGLSHHFQPYIVHSVCTAWRDAHPALLVPLLSEEEEEKSIIRPVDEEETAAKRKKEERKKIRHKRRQNSQYVTLRETWKQEAVEYWVKVRREEKRKDQSKTCTRTSARKMSSIQVALHLFSSRLSCTYTHTLVELCAASFLLFSLPLCACVCGVCWPLTVEPLKQWKEKYNITGSTLLLE